MYALRLHIVLHTKPKQQTTKMKMEYYEFLRLRNSHTVAHINVEQLVLV